MIAVLIATVVLGLAQGVGKRYLFITFKVILAVFRNFLTVHIQAFGTPASIETRSDS